MNNPFRHSIAQLLHFCVFSNTLFLENLSSFAMLDIKWIRAHLEHLDRQLHRRGHAPKSGSIFQLDEQHREVLGIFQHIRSERNTIATAIGHKKQAGQDVSELLLQSKRLLEQEKIAEQRVQELAQQLQEVIETLPNLLDERTPDGKSEEDNVILRHWGTPPTFAFTPKDHTELGKFLGMDFVQTTKISGARFVTLAHQLARLERALSQWLLDMNIERLGCIEMHTPCLVNKDTVYGAGQLPKFSEDLFQTTTEKYLISTSEVTLVNIVRDSILDEKILPLKFTAYTPCFRSEAGSAGKDTKGMLRLHQFEKVELVAICRPEDADDIHQAFVAHEEFLMQALELPYRVVELCSADTGYASARTYDIEVWLPGQSCYREISSCSNCTDYQSRRMQTRYRTAQGTLKYPYTLNGSALPTGRTLIAILENYQQEDGSVLIPEVLRPYMRNITHLVPYHTESPLYDVATTNSTTEINL